MVLERTCSWNISSWYISCEMWSWFPVVSLNNMKPGEFIQRFETDEIHLWICHLLCSLGIGLTLQHCLHLGFKGLQTSRTTATLEENNYLHIYTVKCVLLLETASNVTLLLCVYTYSAYTYLHFLVSLTGWVKNCDSSLK